MKNYVLLTKDESCGLWGVFKSKSGEMYAYPVVYEDGLVSRWKSAKKERKAWGILFKRYIISIRPAEKEMTIAQIEDYCQQHTFAGMPCCVVKGTILKKFMRKLPVINSIIKELDGVPFEAKWYVAKNNENEGSLYYGVHPCATYVAGNGFQGCFYEISSDMKTQFYPAIPY